MAGAHLRQAHCGQGLPSHASKAALGVRSRWHCWSLNKAPKEDKTKHPSGPGRERLLDPLCSPVETPLPGHTGTDPAPGAALHPSAPLGTHCHSAGSGKGDAGCRT